MTEGHWQCWDIANCQKKDQCPAGRQEDKECWDVVREMDDYRSSMKVCEDCLVYLCKEKNSVLTSEEAAAILSKKGVCVLSSICSQDD